MPCYHSSTSCCNSPCGRHFMPSPQSVVKPYVLIAAQIAPLDLLAAGRRGRAHCKDVWLSVVVNRAEEDAGSGHHKSIQVFTIICLHHPLTKSMGFVFLKSLSLLYQPLASILSIIDKSLQTKYIAIDLQAHIFPMSTLPPLIRQAIGKLHLGILQRN